MAYIYIIISSQVGSIPFRELTFPTWGKGKWPSNVNLVGDTLVPWRVISYIPQISRVLATAQLDPISKSTFLQ